MASASIRGPRAAQTHKGTPLASATAIRLTHSHGTFRPGTHDLGPLRLDDGATKGTGQRSTKLSYGCQSHGPYFDTLPAGTLLATVDSVPALIFRSSTFKAAANTSEKLGKG